MMMSSITVEGIEYQQLLNLDIIELTNQHGVCNLFFLLDEDFDTKTLINLDKQKVTVKAEKDIIFCGIITKCSLEEVKYLKVTLMTLSYLLDIEKRTRTFQSAKKKLSEVLSAVGKPYNPIEIASWKDETISQMLYQYQLTDWEFLKEIAERHGQILFVDSKTDKTKLSLGLKKAFKEFKADESTIILSQTVPMTFYKRLEANTYEGARSCYFVDTKLKTYDIKIGVGHGIKYDNQVQIVISSHVYVYDNILFNEVVIRHKEGCYAEAWDVLNHFDKFYYLTGKILESKDTNVKVQFDCDEKQSKDEALDIPYESAASNYLYTMPDEGEKVFVYVDNIRQSAMGILRAKEISEKPENRSFKTKESSLTIDSEKLELAAAKDKAVLTEGDGIKITAKKDLIFSSKGDLILQSAQGLMPDNQLIMAAAHMAGYAQYLATAGQPATVQFNPAGSTVGKVDSQIKNAGTKKETVELSDLAKELDKITNRQAKKESSKSSGGSGGKLTIEGKKGVVLQVKDSSIGMKDKDLNIKTRALMQVGYIPMPGGGSGSVSKFEGGNPNNRSEKINVEHGSEDRSRSKENITPIRNNKAVRIS